MPIAEPRQAGGVIVGHGPPTGSGRGSAMPKPPPLPRPPPERARAHDHHCHARAADPHPSRVGPDSGRHGRHRPVKDLRSAPGRSRSRRRSSDLRSGLAPWLTRKIGKSARPGAIDELLDQPGLGDRESRRSRHLISAKTRPCWDARRRLQGSAAATSAVLPCARRPALAPGGVP